MKLTGAQILVQALIEQDVDVIFGYPGGQVINIFDALWERPDEIRVILPSHEQGGAHAADGYARASGRTGVVLATSGPGATNLVTGIANAYMDSVPMVAITGNVPKTLLGRDSFQEVDICGITLPITKHNFLVQDITQLAAIVKEAFVIANSDRPGPVLIDIPKDIAVGVCEYTSIGRFAPRPYPQPSQSALAEAAVLLRQSQRPLLYAGGGVVSSDSSEALIRFAEAARVPVSTTVMGLTALPRAHPLSLGMIGMHGTPVSNYAAEHCDLLICAGSRFSDRVAGDRTRFAPKAKVIHIDIDPSEFDKNVACDLTLYGNVGDVLGEWTRLAAPCQSEEWMHSLLRFKASHPMPDAVNGAKINPRELLDMVARLAGEDAVVVTDVGQHQMWTAQYYPFTKPRSFVSSCGLGTMGYGMGAAMGVKTAFPDRPVVLVTGDGSFHMNMAEMAAMVTENCPVTIVLMNNGVLGMVRQWQRLFFGARYAGTTLARQTDYAKLADALGGRGFRADDMPEAEKALREALAANQTCLIDCRIDPDDSVFPIIPPGKSIEDIVYCD